MTPRQWSDSKRYLVGDQILYNGNIFENKSGRNSLPQAGDNQDWFFVRQNISNQFSKLRIVSKENGNNFQQIEVGDIVTGMLDKGLFLAFGKYLGNISGDGVQDENNYIVNPIDFNNLK